MRRFPLVLAAAALCTWFLIAASVAEGSQRAPLLNLLERNPMLEEGRAVTANTPVPP